MTDTFDNIIEEEKVDIKFKKYLDKCDTIEKKIVLCKAFLDKYKSITPSKLTLKDDIIQSSAPYPRIHVSNRMFDLPEDSSINIEERIKYLKRDAAISIFEELDKSECILTERIKIVNTNTFRVRMSIKALKIKEFYNKS